MVGQSHSMGGQEVSRAHLNATPVCECWIDRCRAFDTRVPEQVPRETVCQRHHNRVASCCQHHNKERKPPSHSVRFGAPCTPCKGAGAFCYQHHIACHEPSLFPIRRCTGERIGPSIKSGRTDTQRGQHQRGHPASTTTIPISSTTSIVFHYYSYQF